MAEVKTYAADSVAVTWGAQIISGFADGSFLTVEQATDAFTKRVGAQGEVARVRNADRSGRVTMRLLQTSDANAILSALHIADRNTGAGKFPLFIKDISGASLFSAPNAWIVKSSNAEYAQDASIREWVLDCDELTMIHGGNN